MLKLDLDHQVRLKRLSVKFVHPLRVKELRNLTIFFTIIWTATTLKLVTTPTSKLFMIDSAIIFILWVLTSVYFAVICWGRTIKKNKKIPKGLK